MPCREGFEPAPLGTLEKLLPAGAKSRLRAATRPELLAALVVPKVSKFEPEAAEQLGLSANFD